MIFTDEDYQLISEAIKKGGNIWNNTSLTIIKAKIKSFLRSKQDEQCCYCKRSFHGEFKMVIDIEHILPKGKYQSQMFNLNNLAVSCKRCNMNIKGEDTSFFTGNTLDTNTYYIASNYKFIHPNFESYFSHIEYHVKIINNNRIIKYNIVDNSSKGKYTYQYFKLNQLEINTFDEAQGIVNSIPNAKYLDDEKIKEIENLFE